MIGPSDQSLVSELYPRLRRFAAAAAPWDLDPDDLLQDALTRTLERGPLARLDHPAAYLRKTMLHLASNHNRRAAIGKRALTTITVATSQATVDDYPSDLSVLASISPRSRAVVYLTAIEGMRYDEVAEMLGCSSTAARMAAMRARRQLQRAIARHET